MLINPLFIYCNFLQTLHAVLNLFANLEQGHVCPTGVFPCPVDATQVLKALTTSMTPSSFRGQYLSWDRRGENLKVPSQGYRVDVPYVWWLP